MAKKKRKKGKRRGTRRRRRNPFAPTGVMGDITRSVTRAYNLEALQAGGTMVGGAIINSMARDFISNMLGLAPESPIRYAVGLSTAGLLGMGVNRVLPGRGSQAFMGAMTFEVARAYNQYVAGMMGWLPKAGTSGFGDFLVQPQVSGAVPAPLGVFGDYLQQPQIAGAVPSPMGGFLDPYHRTAGGMLGLGDMGAISEELGQQDTL